MWAVSVNDVWRYSKGNLTAIVVDFSDGAIATVYNTSKNLAQDTLDGNESVKAVFYGQLDGAKAWAKAYIDLENL